jgi:hypothetical protein
MLVIAGNHHRHRGTNELTRACYEMNVQIDVSLLLAISIFYMDFKNCVHPPCIAQLLVRFFYT